MQIKPGNVRLLIRKLRILEHEKLKIQRDLPNIECRKKSKKNSLLPSLKCNIGKK